VVKGYANVFNKFLHVSKTVLTLLHTASTTVTHACTGVSPTCVNHQTAFQK